MRFGRVARVYLAANSGFARLRPTSMTTPKHLYFACLIVAAPVVDDPSCHALQPCTTPGTPQMSLAGTGSLHDRQEDVLARNERGIFIRSGEVHDPGLAHLYNVVPYQRRAQHAGQCGVEVEGGTVPTRDWFLNLQILTSGGFR